MSCAAGCCATQKEHYRLFWRLWGNVSVGNGCWTWRTPSKEGYGYIRVRGPIRPAHRVAYELMVGPIPSGLELDHLCRNRACVRPDHLEPVTHRENVLRGSSMVAQAARQTHCVHGHPLGGENLYTYRDRRYCVACQKARAAKYREKKRALR